MCIRQGMCLGKFSWYMFRPVQQSVCRGSACRQLGRRLSPDRTMELVEHRNSSDVGGGPLKSSLELGVRDHPDMSNNGSQSGTVGLTLTPQRPLGEGTEGGQVGPLEVFYPEEAAESSTSSSSVVVAEALTCQVKITTRRSLHLRIANHTTRDVYVRLVGHGGRIAGVTAGRQRSILEQSKMRSKGKNTAVSACLWLMKCLMGFGVVLNCNIINQFFNQCGCFCFCLIKLKLIEKRKKWLHTCSEAQKYTNRD